MTPAQRLTIIAIIFALIMVWIRLTEKKMDKLDFICTTCGKPFSIPIRDYRGEFDHPPNEPTCPSCKDAA